MNQCGTQTIGFFGKHARCNAVDLHRQIRLLLRAIHCCVGTGVQNQRGLDIFAATANSIGIGQIKLIAVERKYRTELRESARQFPTELAVFTRDENARRVRGHCHQANTSALASVGASASARFNCGSPASGQSMPSAGSFHNRLRSNAGA